MRITNVANGLRGFALTTLTVVFVGLGATAAMAKPAYIGTWASNAADCRSGDIAVAITPREVGLIDSVCRIRSVSGGRGFWRMKTRCVTDGVRTNERFFVWANARRLTVEFASTVNPGFRTNYLRCR